MQALRLTIGTFKLLGKRKELLSQDFVHISRTFTSTSLNIELLTDLSA